MDDDRTKDDAGTELYRQRIRVSLDFDVTVNDGKIVNSGNDAEVKAFDLALLKRFLVADQAMLRLMLAYQVALNIAWRNAEDIEEWLLGSIMEANYERRLYGPAIDTMEGPEGEYWRETRALPPDKYGDALSICTEYISECFQAQYVDSRVEMIDTKTESE